MQDTQRDNPVTAIAAAAPDTARMHFAQRLRFETDCADVHTALTRSAAGFAVLDVRSAQAFARGHVPGSHSLPRAEITADRLRAFGPNTTFVVYCAGPHCNAAQRAALAIADLGFPVKEMLGGAIGWRDEGFELEGHG